MSKGFDPDTFPADFEAAVRRHESLRQVRQQLVFTCTHHGKQLESTDDMPTLSCPEKGCPVRVSVSLVTQKEST